MSTIYHPYRVNLTAGQAESVAKAMKHKTPITLRLSYNNLIVNVLPDLINEYNNHKHSTIKMTPTEASMKYNEKVIQNDVYSIDDKTIYKSKFKVGDRVRISKYKRTLFDKGYTPNWSEEVFVIVGIQHTNPTTYIIKDYNNEIIKGSFYENELQKTDQDFYRIDKVIKKDYKKKLALVSWKGYPKEFNSWIPLNDVKNI